MQFTALRAMVRKDLQLFISDRRAVIMSFIAPIAIASFFGSLFSGPGNSEPAKSGVSSVDEEASAVSKRIAAGAAGDKTLAVSSPTREAARDEVRAGKVTVA